jgi:hypothetical protein
LLLVSPSLLLLSISFEKVHASLAGIDESTGNVYLDEFAESLENNTNVTQKSNQTLNQNIKTTNSSNPS